MRNKQVKDVFEFNDDDNPEECDRWSKIRAKLENPNFDDDSVNAQFLIKNSPGPVTQIKEVPTITLDDDDDDHYYMDDSPVGPLDSAPKAGCEESKGFYPVSEDKVLEQCSGFNETCDNNIEHQNSPPRIQIRLPNPIELPPENGRDLPMIPESPCFNGSAYFEGFDDLDMVQESSPSSPDSEPEENNVPTVGQAPCQLFGGLEMDVMDTIVILTDYVTYGDKYFPASLILFSGDSVKIKESALEVDTEASISEWKLEDILRIETQRSSSVDVAKVRIQLVKNNASHTVIANENSGVEVVECLVTNWSQYQEQIMSLNVSYNALLSMPLNRQSCHGDAALLEDIEYSSDPFIPNFEEHFEEVVYPKGEVDAVSVRKSDVDLLLPDVFVNDTIIDFYITYLKNAIPQERRHTFHFFSSFFFRKLADLDKNPSSISDGKAAFQRVRRWTRKVNIFEKDYIFIPVNYNLHWSLIILCHPGEVVKFNGENINEALKVPCILHMDSIRGTHAGLKDLLQSYLLEEWKERQKEPSEDVTSKFLNLRFLSLELPQQENFSDCGLFLLHYAELFIDEAPQNFSPFQINKFDRFLKPDWFMPAEASLKRVYIQRLIYELLKSLSHECASPPKNNLPHSPTIHVNKESDTGIVIISEKRSLESSWNGNSLCSEPVRGMETGLLNMQIYRPSHCVDNAGLGMTELLDQQSQHYDRGPSLGQLDFDLSTIEEVEGNDHLAHSNLGQTELQPVEQVGEYHIPCSPGDFDQQDQWNSDLSDEDYPEDTLLSSDSRSCDDSQSSEDTKILERNEETQSVDSCQNENTDQSKEIVESQEGFASATSDMMETPAENSEELAEKYGSHDYDQEDKFLRSLEDVVKAPEEELCKTEDGGIISLSSVDEMLVVENSKIEDDMMETPAKTSQELADKNDQEDPFPSNFEDVVEASQEELDKTEDEVISLSSVDEKLVVEDGKIENDEAVVGDVVAVSMEELDKTKDDVIISLSAVDEKLAVEDDKIERDEVIARADEAWVVEDFPPDQQRPTKRLRVSPLPGDESV